MRQTDVQPQKAGPRDLRYLKNPQLWPAWPLLPVVRYRPDGDYDCGLLFDLEGALNLPGYQTTVFQANMLLLPSTLDELLALPKEVFTTAEEIAAAGWRVD